MAAAANPRAWSTAPVTSHSSLPTISPVTCSGGQAMIINAAQTGIARVRSSPIASSRVPSRLPTTKRPNTQVVDPSDWLASITAA